MKARTSGQILKRGERKWLVRWYNGRSSGGKRQYASTTVHGSKKDADAKLREVLRQRDLGAVVVSKAMPLGEYLDRWIEEAARPRLRFRTTRHYEMMLKLHVRPALGMRRLDRITPLDVQGLVNGIAGQGKIRTARLACAFRSW